MQEQKWNQNGWAFLASSLDQIPLSERKLNTWSGGTMWAGFSPELSLDTSLCSWEAFQKQQEAVKWGTNFRHGLLHSAAVACKEDKLDPYRIRRGLLWGVAPHKRNGDISTPHLNKKIFSVALWIALKGREKLSWAAVEGGFDEDQCCSGHSKVRRSLSCGTVLCFHSLWQGCSLWKSINLNQIKLMCCHIYPSHWLSYIMF